MSRPLPWPRFHYDPLSNRPKPYRVTHEYVVYTGILGEKVIHPFYELTMDGWLTIKVDYRWDGGTCALDSHGMVASSLPHDVLCEATNSGALDYKHRAAADKLFRDHLNEFCESWLARQWRWVRWAGVRINSERVRPNKESN